MSFYIPRIDSRFSHEIWRNWREISLSICLSLNTYLILTLLLSFSSLSCFFIEYSLLLVVVLITHLVDLGIEFMHCCVIRHQRLATIGCNDLWRHEWLMTPLISCHFRCCYYTLSSCHDWVCLWRHQYICRWLVIISRRAWRHYWDPFVTRSFLLTRVTSSVRPVRDWVSPLDARDVIM